MNDIHRGRVPNDEKPFPGCMGRVINLIDYGPRMTTNRLLTDRAHSDGPVSKASTRDRSQEKTIPNELRCNGTPMKMLIAHEMSKEAETKQKPANLVAKLMGLDALPEQQTNQMSQRSQMKGHLQSPLSRSSTPPRFLKHEGDFLDKQIQHGVRPFLDQQEYKDVYEVWQQSPKGKFVQHKSPEKGYSEKANERGMNLVREKFNEAKRLATDENLRQSKEFQDALEVLSSNKELFLKFLQEPNSLFSQQLYELQSLPLAPHTKHITVLRPSKSLGNNTFVGYEETKQKPTRDRSQSLEEDIWEKNKSRSNSFSNQKNDKMNHPTRIVILKPSPRKTQEVAAAISSPTLSSERHHKKDYFEELENEEAQCSREVAAKEITQQMHETYPNEDTFLSSVFSNGYVGDESSFNRSDNEYVGDGNFSDSEIMTPTSRVSWDYANKFGSPYSSFSRASYSPESSVCREAKKRLSERWAMMASNGNGEEQQQIRRSSSTLGEMLALTETKKPPRPNIEGIREAGVSTSRSYGGEQEFRDSKSFMLDSEKNDGVEFESPKNLLRSRSVPVSSTAYGSRLNVEVPDLDIPKPKVPNGMEKSKSVKSSFKGKVSSLFFSRTKKRSKDKSAATPIGSLQSKSGTVETPKELEVNAASVRTYDDHPQCVTGSSLEEEGPFQSFGAVLSSSASSPSTCVEQKQGKTFLEVLSMDKSIMTARCSSENLNQPSPVSVLEALFEEENAGPPPSGSVKTDLQGSLLHDRSLKSNLISKSPRIESLARSLSWDNASDLATPVHSKYSSVFPSIADEEQEWLVFIQKLLSSAGMSGGELSDARWHSPECPLDPKLLEKFVDLNEDKFQWHETRYRRRRINQKLIFDSVNETLVDIIRYKSNASLWRRCSNATRVEASSVGDSETLVTAEDIWNRMKEWFSGETKCFSGENEDSNSLVVERVVKKEVVGRGWVENMKLEVDGIGKEIEEKMLGELVEGALFELAGRIR